MKSLLFMLLFYPVTVLSQRYHEPNFKIIGPHQICPTVNYTYQKLQTVGIDVGLVGLVSKSDFVGLYAGSNLHFTPISRDFGLRSTLHYRKTITSFIAVGAKMMVWNYKNYELRDILYSPSVGIHIGALQFYYGWNLNASGHDELNTINLNITIGN